MGGPHSASQAQLDELAAAAQQQQQQQQLHMLQQQQQQQQQQQNMVPQSGFANVSMPGLPAMPGSDYGMYLPMTALQQACTLLSSRPLLSAWLLRWKAACVGVGHIHLHREACSSPGCACAEPVGAVGVGQVGL
jgi:hypothetical protein